MRLEGWIQDGLMSNEAFINNADDNNVPLGVLLEAPLGAYRRLKMNEFYEQQERERLTQFLFYLLSN